MLECVFACIFTFGILDEVATTAVEHEGFQMTPAEHLVVEPHEDKDKFWCVACTPPKPLAKTSAHRHFTHVHHNSSDIVKNWVVVKDANRSRNENFPLLACSHWMYQVAEQEEEEDEEGDCIPYLNDIS